MSAVFPVIAKASSTSKIEPEEADCNTLRASIEEASKTVTFPPRSERPFNAAERSADFPDQSDPRVAWFKLIVPEFFSLRDLSAARVRLPPPVTIKFPVENDRLSSALPKALN